MVFKNSKKRSKKYKRSKPKKSRKYKKIINEKWEKKYEDSEIKYKEKYYKETKEKNSKTNEEHKKNIDESDEKKESEEKECNKGIYCGNNRLFPDLVNGTLELGTRYKCLRKGYGKGFNMPVDPNYLNNQYDPIDRTRLYCGDNPDLPAGYDRHGNLVHCLQRGVGLGKKQKAIQNQNNN